jgi:hypothetical protein
MQAKLAINQPGDQFEQEADRVAEQVMRMPDPAIRLQPKCGCAEPGSSGDSCEACADTPLVQRSPADTVSFNTSVPHTPPDVRSSGQALDPASQEFMEARFGHNFSDVRVHTDASASRSARAINALAYTVGKDIVFGTGQYAPYTNAGRRLLAHELTHVQQQRSGRVHASVQRFHMPHGTEEYHQRDETSQIAPTFADVSRMLNTIINDCTTNGVVNMDRFVQRTGGSPALAHIRPTSVTPLDPLLTFRYVFTCRCGLIDLRHFFQMMYISHFVAHTFQGIPANRSATRRGRAHELDSEPESRFAPEDAPSNALGAFTGAGLPGFPQPADLLHEIERTLRRCGPVDFSTLSPASRDTITHHYGELVPDPAIPGALTPAHRNESAVPDILGISECSGRMRSFPFTLDTSEPTRNTIAGEAFDFGSSGLTSDSDIRDFVSTQRAQIIRALPASEKVRMVRRLLTGWVAAEDLNAVEVIFRNSSDAERTQIRGAVNLDDFSGVERLRLRVILGL